MMATLIVDVSMVDIDHDCRCIFRTDTPSLSHSDPIVAMTVVRTEDSSGTIEG